MVPRLTLTAACFLSIAAADRGSAQLLVIRAERILPITGPPIHNGTIIVLDGKIQAVGTELRIPVGAKVLTAHTVMPGLIDSHSYLGIHQELIEPADSLTPDLRAIDAFDPTDPVISRALRAGITSVAIMPPNSNVIGGQPAIIRLGRVPQILRDSAGLKFSISPDSANSQRNPTSRAGIADLISHSVSQARKGLPTSSARQTRLLAGGIPTSLSNRVAPVSLVTRGVFTAFIHAPGLGDGEIALEIAQRASGARLAILHPQDSVALAPQLSSPTAIVALGPLGFKDNDRTLKQAGKLTVAGVSVTFCTDSPQSDPASLRMTAHLAVKHGMPAQQAIKALTINAARLLGIDSRTGSISVGKDADLLLLTGDPIDLTSRIVAVISAGKIAHSETP
jgi:imidazolonepropionase-like amidohydrolase